MIVPDASAVVEMLQSGPFAVEMMDAMDAYGAVAPHLLDVEVVSAIRGLVSGGRIAPLTAKRMVDDLIAFPIARVEHGSLLNRIWELRHNFTPYDASYIALAERTNSVLYTMDAKLAGGHHARVVLFRP